MIIGFLDTETTGTDAKVDQVIEVGLACVTTNQKSEVIWRLKEQPLIWRIKPGVPISPAAQAVHGITLEALAHERTFGETVDFLTDELAQLDVVAGYNLDFDLQMIEAEYRRVNKPNPFKPDIIQLDVYKLWRALEPRDLGSAHKRFAGVPIEGAHNAGVDAAATRDVLDGMLDHFNITSLDWDTLANRADPERAVRFGPSSHLRWNGDSLVITFGKHQGKTLVGLVATTPDYLRWMTNPPTREGGGFPPHVVEACRKALTMSATDFHRWARERR